MVNMQKQAGSWRVAWLTAIAIMAVGYGASAAVVTMNLGTVTDGGFPSGDRSSSPYLNATITDGTDNGSTGVYLKMSCPGLGFAGSGMYEHVLGWDFNVSSISGLTASSFTQTAKSGNVNYSPQLGFLNPNIGWGTTGSPSHGAYQADNSGDYYSLQFLFHEHTTAGTDGPDGGVEFGNGDSVTYFIKGLSASSFVVATKSNGTPDTYYSAAQIDDGQANTWIAGGITTPVPEPTTMIAGALLLLPFGASTVRVLRRR